MKQAGDFQKPSLSFICSEDWNAMHPCEQGRFCGSCRKTVVDFTQKSEPEIREMLAKREGEVCGRFYAHQLAAPVRTHRFSFRQVLASFLVLLGLGAISREATAQQKQTPARTSAKSKSKVKAPVLMYGTDCLTRTYKNGDIEIAHPTSEPYIPEVIDLTGIEGLVSGAGLTDTTKKEAVIFGMIAEEMPVFKNGGTEGMMKFLAENLKYPAEPVEGMVVTTFIINEKGQVTELKIARSLSPEADQETLRVVRLMEFLPAKRNGKVVPVPYTLPVRFANK